MKFPEGMGDKKIAGAEKRDIIDDWENPTTSRSSGRIASDSNDSPPKKQNQTIDFSKVKRGRRKKKYREIVLGAGPENQSARFTELEAEKKPSRHGQLHLLNSTNIYGLSSRSESKFPEAFKPVNIKYWQQISEDERSHLIAAQAEVMRKVHFRPEEKPFLHFAATEADSSYEIASGRRAQIMRRRIRKPRNYEERKRYEEMQRKAPLVRPYVAREMAQYEPTAFFSESPIGPKILIPAFIGKGKKKKQAPEAKPSRLKRIEWRDRFGEGGGSEGPIELPTFDAKRGSNISLQTWNTRYGLKPRELTMYPEAYKDISDHHWQQMSEIDRDKVMRVQASGMEKVGFERGTHKHFIEDFDPSKVNIYKTHEPEIIEIEKKPPHPLSKPFGIIAIIVGLFAIVGAIVSPMSVFWIIPGSALAALGVMLLVTKSEDDGQRNAVSELDPVDLEIDIETEDFNDAD